MGIQTRIITDKNIDNVLGISGTDNIIKITKDTDIREVLKKNRTSIHKYANAYRRERMSQIEKKTKTGAPEKKKPKKIVAKPDKKEEEFDKVQVDIIEGGEGVEPVTYTINDVPVEIPEAEPPTATSAPPQPTASNIVQYPQEMELTNTETTQTPESVTDVLKVPEEKEEDENKEESGEETKKSITVNL
jgi:hypothetical protein